MLRLQAKLDVSQKSTKKAIYAKGEATAAANEAALRAAEAQEKSKTEEEEVNHCLIYIFENVYFSRP
jgi:hypothetical protein